MSSSTSSLGEGTVIGDRYKIVCEVAQGSSGTVYKALHLVLDQPVAIKVLSDKPKKDDTAFLRFQREAQAASALNHPNIVKIFDFGLSESGHPFLVMSYVEGRSLKQILDSDGKIDLKRALPIFMQICDALQLAHDNGIVYRDLKPDNIMLVEQGTEKDQIKLVDFGIAKRFNDAYQKKLTMDGQIFGAPGYLSPEQIMGQSLDARSDVYCMGCLMFKVLTGVEPIQGSTAAHVMENHLNKAPLNFNEACPTANIPIGVQFVVQKALKKSPRDRHQSMQELSNALESLQ